MKSFIRKQNYRQIQLTDPPSSTELVGVYLRSGELKYLPWRGFLTREQALDRKAVPVKLDIFAVIPSDEIGTPRIELADGEFGQGALLMDDGLEVVFGVLDGDGTPRVISS